MTGCLEGLERLHDDHPTVFPKPIIQDTWEELHWRFWEELKEVMRALKREVGRDSLRRSDIILFALTPGADGTAWLKLPATFSLDSTAGWFRASILTRIERKHQRALWDLTWKTPKPAAPPRAGGEGPAGPRMYPVGKNLGPHESRLSTEHAPLGPEGGPGPHGGQRTVQPPPTPRPLGGRPRAPRRRLSMLGWIQTDFAPPKTIKFVLSTCS